MSKDPVDFTPPPSPGQTGNAGFHIDFDELANLHSARGGKTPETKVKPTKTTKEKADPKPMHPLLRQALMETSALAAAYATLPVWAPVAALAGGVKGFVGTSYTISPEAKKNPLYPFTRPALMTASVSSKIGEAVKDFLFYRVGLKRVLIGGPLVFAAAWLGMNILKDNYNPNTNVTLGEAASGNITYAAYKGTETAGKFAYETGAPCVNDPLECGTGLADAALDAAVTAGKTSFGWLADTYIDLNKSFYRWNFNQVARALTGRTPAPAVSAPAAVPTPKAATAAQKPTQGPASLTTQVELCRNDYSDGKLRAENPENWTLMQSYHDVMKPRLERAKNDPNSTVGRALKEAYNTGKDVAIIMPKIEDYIAAYNTMVDAGQVKSPQEFNKLVFNLPSGSPHSLNFAAVTKARSAASYCPQGEKWMTGTAFDGNPKPIRYYLEDFMKNEIK